jgi:NADPH-dependent 2,4-dienoyl-CoA reductase/sulfur reductase-like enzyme
MGTLDPELADRVHDALTAKGVTVRLGEELRALEPASGGGESGGGNVVTDRGAVPADLVVLGMGVRPNTDRAREAGVPLSARGAIAVDRRQRTGSDGVWAAGDCAAVHHRVSQQPTHVALGTVANKTGRVAGINLGGGYATFKGVLGTAITKVCEVGIGRTGLTSREAEEAGFETVVGAADTTVQAGYMRAPGFAHVRLVCEQGTGRLLGGQIVGTQGVAKHIDTVATALWTDLTCHDLIDLDLSYAPPFSSVWDPVQQAARVALRAL